ncbi:peroxide stress protein YaaA [Streptococcus caprae]|uniref:UPF0246 protein ACFORF_02540 n=1 Tax=Streptococcus caprae TaxID=1640501 RepID=A0ABV8CU45_9STRE
MKIILPNAKELNTYLEAQPAPVLSQQSQAILDLMQELSPEELSHCYKLNLDRCQLEADRWQRISQGDAKAYPAWLLYDGLMFRYMKRQGLTQTERNYLAKTAFIATGFYGLISVFDPISPHRLDFQVPVRIEGQSLKQYWRQQFYQVVADDELVLDLVSSEFKAVFSPQQQKRMIKLTFMEEKSGQLKVHSTISKKGRGRFLSLMAEQQVQSLEALKVLQTDGFSYREDLSSSHELVFVRPT